MTIQAISKHLEDERERIVIEESTIARNDWAQFFQALARMEIRLVCATIEAVSAIKRLETK